MAQLIVRNLEDDVRDKLRDLARSHGRSMEEEAREILRGAVLNQRTASPQIGSRLAQRFAAVGLDEPIPELRGQPVKPPNLER